MGASVKVGVSLLHRHRAIGWHAFWVAWLNSRGRGGGVESGCSSGYRLACILGSLVEFQGERGRGGGVESGCSKEPGLC